MTPIFYHPGQKCPGFDFVSLNKVEQFISMSGRDYRSDFGPVSRDDLCTVHNPVHVDSILQHKSNNGFKNARADLNESILYSNGCFVAAADYALREGGVACSATQGFHHAGRAICWGYCTFNGLMIAAQTVCKDQKVLIIDGDAHHGDGTDDCISQLGLGSRVVNVSRGPVIGTRVQSRWNFAMWHVWAKELIQMHDPGIIFYQAGADAWTGDPYGCGYLTKDGMRSRDIGVFSASKALAVPVVWNLAGGYADPMIKTTRLHLQTLDASDEVFYGRQK